MKEKKKILPLIAKFIICIFILTVVEFFALVIVAMIPQKNIHQHTMESADILLEQEVFYDIDPKDLSSRIDRYADSILLNIAYSYDEAHPIESVMRSSYYFDETKNENVNLHTAVNNQTKANKNYFRYWHGSNVIIRPLLLFTNINGIYILNALLLVALLLCVLLLLWKKCSPAIAICMACSCVTISFWYIPFSLEYTWNFLIMLTACILTFFLYHKKETTLFLFFFILGNITAYFDFLSTETITYTMPFLFVLLLNQKQKLHEDNHVSFSFLFKTAFMWLFGYALSWIMKWTLATLILDTNAFQFALQQANTRITSQSEDISIVSQSFGSLIRNISCLFPFSFMASNGFSICIITAIILGIFFFLFKKEKSTTFSIMLLLISLVPYLRFITISNHSYLHYFFTYRAQVASMFAIGLTMIYGTDYNLVKKEWNKLCKKKKKS